MSGPYTIRERRENIAKHGPEAYPGQREKLLADLIASDAARAADERERASEARNGARSIRSQMQATLALYGPKVKATR